MNTTFKSRVVEENENYSEKEIGEAVKSCFGIWKDREDFKDFNNFRQQAWKIKQQHE